MKRIAKLEVTSEQLRSLVIEALASEPESQMRMLGRAVADVAVKRGMAPNSLNSGYIGGDLSLSPGDYSRMQDVFWDLLTEGVVRPGLTDGINEQWPWYHVTEYGQQVIKGASPSPHDPDGYMKRLTETIPNLDGVIKEYLIESIHTFRINCLLSSTVTIGAASEKAFLLLLEAYTSALSDPTRQAKFRKDTEGRPLKRQWDEFNKMLQGHLVPLLPGDLTDGLDVILNGVFLLIRNCRNDAGHPTGRKVAREQAYANLQLFPSYLRRVYALIEWLGKNPL